VNLAALVAIQAIAGGISAVGMLFVASNLFRQLKRLCHSTATIIDNNNHRQNMSISSPTSCNRPQVIVAATSL